MELYDWLDEKYGWIPFWFKANDWLHPKRIWRKIIHCWRWLPIIWEDVDWDYSSLLVMLEFKLRNMRDSQTKYHNHEEWEKVAGTLEETRACIARLHADEYADAEWDAHRLKYPSRMDFENWEKTEDGCVKMPDFREGEGEEVRRMSGIQEAGQKADLELFGKLFREHLFEWWD